MSWKVVGKKPPTPAVGKRMTEQGQERGSGGGRESLANRGLAEASWAR